MFAINESEFATLEKEGGEQWTRTKKNTPPANLFAAARYVSYTHMIINELQFSHLSRHTFFHESSSNAAESVLVWVSDRDRKCACAFFLCVVVACPTFRPIAYLKPEISRGKNDCEIVVNCNNHRKEMWNKKRLQQSECGVPRYHLAVVTKMK